MAINNKKTTQGISDRMSYVDFAKPQLCQATYPVSCSIMGTKIEIIGRQNWVQLLVVIIECFIKMGNKSIKELYTKPLYRSMPRGNTPVEAHPFFLSERPSGHLNAVRLSNKKWINVNYSIPEIVKIIGLLCKRCGVDVEQVKITYKPKILKKDAASSFPLFAQTVSASLSYAKFDTIKAKSNGKKAVKAVLEAHFQNGFRIDSIIELARFRCFAAEDNTKGIPADDNALKEAIKASGSIHEGKVFVIRQTTNKAVKDLISSILKGGTGVIYYKSFFEKHREMLINGGISSEDLLRGFIKEMFPSLFCRKNRVTTKYISSEKMAIKNEIIRVKGNDEVFTQKILEEKLPYIPCKRIKHVLTISPEFIRTHKGEYIYISTINLSETDIQDINNYVVKNYREKRWATLSGYNFDAILEHNSDITKQAIITFFSNYHLKKGYKQNGKVITRMKDNFNSYDILEEYCRKAERCSLKELFAFGREITGEIHCLNALKAAYAVLVRTDKKSFVADKYVYFNIPNIDKAIDTFVSLEYLPIKAITTFAGFPFCGEAWNLYLLESYCLKFSKTYKYECLVPNSKHAGVIVKRKTALKYEEILVDAVAKSGITLKDETVIDFLSNNGYTASRSYAKINELIIRAKAIRKGSA
jgi:hypothetical protein